MRKVLVTFLTIGSLLGISAVTAMAEENSWTITVEVEDTSLPPCVPDILAGWAPDETLYSAVGVGVPLARLSLDLFSPQDLDFYVTLGLDSGTDSCDADVPLTGTIVASFSSSDGLSLIAESLTCPATLEPLCTANFMSGGPSGGKIEGTIAPPAEIGDYTGTLRVVWTP